MWSRLPSTLYAPKARGTEIGVKLVQRKLPVGSFVMADCELLPLDPLGRDVAFEGLDVIVLGVLQTNVSRFVLQILHHIFNIAVRQVHFELRFLRVVFPSPSRYQERRQRYGGSKKIKS